MKRKNILKGWITSVIGTITMALTLFLVYNGTFDFLWEGIAGLSIGCILLLAPETIEKKISEAIQKWNGSKLDSTSPSNDDQITE